MLNSVLRKIPQIPAKLIKFRFWRFNVCLSIAIGMAIANTFPAIAAMRIEGLSKGNVEIAEVEVRDRAESMSVDSPLADGFYLFGGSPQDEQYGITYVVFEVRQGKVNGALYEVNSEYRCFAGTLDNQNLNLLVEDFEGEVYPYAIALEDRGTIATNEGIMRIVGLQGYHQLAELGDIDRTLLKSCREI
ncbi:hypothetical protein [Spirulina sp. 06S082]|uniref:hypothetical protein n=1 Tax=Spirulina sp. 06S082 TaxID=3110248 RepID=UPI002B21334D|nr:hypothetical protein [Spirulina sp. 06S082]MEA5469938.1 hypothetical protein [Spirulina sp. 06S082]